MRLSQTATDKMAIGISVLCAFHCLVLPVTIIFLPSVMAAQLENEAFHLWMVLAVIPISLYALTLGCQQHKRYSIALLGVIGLLLLVAAIFVAEPFLGELGEKTFTLLGSCLIVAGHWYNYRLCRSKTESCAC
ncbi:MAG: MerC domain-containing protein [Pseudomonadota bacterium]